MSRITQHTTQTSYIINNYIVVIERAKNDINGNPRYNAILTNLENLRKWGNGGAYSYTFGAYYCTEREACEYILKHHKEKYNIK